MMEAHDFTKRSGTKWSVLSISLCGCFHALEESLRNEEVSENWGWLEYEGLFVRHWI